MREGTEGLAVKKFHSFIPELLNLNVVLIPPNPGELKLFRLI